MILSIAFALWFGIVSYQAKRNFIVYALEGAAMFMVINFIASGFLSTLIKGFLAINESVMLSILCSIIALILSVFLGDIILEKMRDKILSEKVKKQQFVKLNSKF